MAVLLKVLEGDENGISNTKGGGMERVVNKDRRVLRGSANT